MSKREDITELERRASIANMERDRLYMRVSKLEERNKKADKEKEIDDLVEEGIKKIEAGDEFCRKIVGGKELRACPHCQWQYLLAKEKRPFTAKEEAEVDGKVDRYSYKCAFCSGTNTIIVIPKRL